MDFPKNDRDHKNKTSAFFALRLSDVANGHIILFEPVIDISFCLFRIAMNKYL